MYAIRSYYDVLAIKLVRQGTRPQAATLAAETHRATEVGMFRTSFDVARCIQPLCDQADHGRAGVLVDLGAVGVSYNFV